MTRLSLVLAAVGFVAHFAPAADEPAPKPKPAPTLKVGDPAPPLKVTKWLQGAEVKQFEPGKVYVVEFWATWSCLSGWPWQFTRVGLGVTSEIAPEVAPMLFDSTFRRHL